MHIGIFDSGDGGRFVMEKLQSFLPQHTYHRVADPEHAPYGKRSFDDIRRLLDNAIQPLIPICPIIVIACNTATAAGIDVLRQRYPQTVFIGFEPMIKPAARISQSKKIALLATHATQTAERTKQLIAAYAADCTITTVDTSDWAYKIDHQQTEHIDVSAVVAFVAAGGDTIIIGCTHYIALIPTLSELCPQAHILEPTEAVAGEISRQATRLLE